MESGASSRQPPTQMEDMFARAVMWWNGQEQNAPDPQQKAVPDFLAQAPSPDKMRSRHLEAGQGRPTLEDRWLQQCQEVARDRDLSHIRDMRIVFVAPHCHDRMGNMVLMVVAGHCKRHSISSEELLLHGLQEMQKIGGKQYSVVYLNADADLAAVPDTRFLQQLHAGMPPSHPQQLQAIYAVHPTTTLRGWVVALKLRIPVVYQKLVFCDFLSDLYKYISPEELPDIPQHVLDKDAKRNGKRTRF